MILILLLSLLIPSLVSAAISCGDVTNTITATDSSSDTTAYTTPAGSNQVLIVANGWRDGTDTLNTVTHNGVTISNKQSVKAGDTGAGISFKVAPVSGTNNVVTTWSGGSGTVLAHSTVIYTCSGASQDADPFRNAGVTNSGSGTTPTVTASSSAGDVVLDSMAIDGNTSAPTAGTGQTPALFAGSPGSEFAAGVSQQAGGGDDIMSWTGTSNDWTIAAVVLKEFIATGRRKIMPFNFQ